MLHLDGTPLTLPQVVAVARAGEPITITAEALERMAATAAVIARLNSGDEVAYGVTTGFGALADRTIDREQRAQLQRALVLSHSAGMGTALDREIVRGMMLLRLRTLCAGRSGVRPEVAQALAGLLNAQLTPWVPRHGSLGASGDLAPLAHAASVLLGNGHVIDPDPGRPGSDGDRRRDGAEALREAGLSPITLGPKEGLALINGTDAMAATMTLAITDLEQLMRALDCAAAMSVEALLGTPHVFDADLVGLRPSDGVRASATNLRRLLDGSPIVASHRDSHHAVQDAYSLRCTPQVHGAARDLLGFARATVERELQSIVDNPVVTADGHLASTGNFHGQALAYAADCCALLCADLAGISERRTDRLLDDSRSRGLPAFLTREPGLNSGLMIAQYTAAACGARLRLLSTPMSVMSASTSAGQEDHVSMGFEAALRTRESVDQLRRVVAVELVCAAQALDLRAPLAPAAGTGAVRSGLRGRVATLEQDRPLADDLAAATTWLADDDWLSPVTAVTGELA